MHRENNTDTYKSNSVQSTATTYELNFARLNLGVMRCALPNKQTPAGLISKPAWES